MKEQTGEIEAVHAALLRWRASVSDKPRVCVAYSGGMDSSVLLHALVALRAQFPAMELTAHHVNHGLSKNAKHWEAHCERVCGALDVALHISAVHVDLTGGIGVEAAARNARYGALRASAQASDTVVALAHHARDQAETVLLQLLRGAGADGLAAMPDAAPPFARPLLGIEKSIIESYANLRRIEYVTDESNLNSRFARNRLRKYVWTGLIDAFPNAERTLSRSAQLQEEASQLATDLAEIDLARCSMPGVAERALSLAAWCALSTARRRNLLRHWLATCGIPTQSFARICEWERQLQSERPTQQIALRHRSFRGAIRRYRDRIEYVEEETVPAGSTLIEPERVTWRGERELAFGGGFIRFNPADPSDIELNAARLRPIKPGETWIIRLRQVGDKIELSQNSGRVILKNLFQTNSVPIWKRANWPILTCDGVIAAVVGLAIADGFRAQANEAGTVAVWLAPSRGSG